jgi:hypothetical protein
MAWPLLAGKLRSSYSLGRGGEPPLGKGPYVWRERRRRHHENHDCCRGHCPEPRLRDDFSICGPRGEHGDWDAHGAGGFRSGGSGCGRCRGLYCRPRYRTLLGAVTTALYAVTSAPSREIGFVGPCAEKQASGVAAGGEANVLTRHSDLDAWCRFDQRLSLLCRLDRPLTPLTASGMLSTTDPTRFCRAGTSLRQKGCGPRDARGRGQARVIATSLTPSSRSYERIGRLPPV